VSPVEPVFQELMAGLDYAMFVVTAAAEGQRAGCLVGFASQCSIHPPRFVVWISKKNRTYPVARRARTLAVHLLAPRHRDVVELFGHETGDEVDKFARCSWRPGPDGAPILDACPSWFAGRVVGRLDTGDHLGFLLEPVAATKGSDEPGLGFQAVKDVDPGHEP
jgi:flavin reductase (DIM6/NTAB) family NADH-FMN oxidoreductase RutF